MSNEKQTATIELKLGWIGGGIYIAIGILYQLLTGDGPFSWSDPWVYASMFLWPFFLLGWVIVAILAVLSIVGLIWYFTEERPRQRRLNETDKIRRAAVKRHREEMEERRRAAAKATPSQED